MYYTLQFRDARVLQHVCSTHLLSLTEGTIGNGGLLGLRCVCVSVKVCVRACVSVYYKK